MTKRMLIDAAHAEETRVVVVDGTRIEELDFESQSRKQLRGNIYLAKVTRVEPSLQAAFVEYGGNRHGFLAFNEIHPDYYQIPLADREALMREEAEEEEEERPQRRGRRAPARNEAEPDSESAGAEDEDLNAIDDDDDVMEEELERRRRRLMRRYKIQEVIKRRQIMLIQVVKEERGNKGAALTTYLSLAGRYCVLMPNTARGGGISRKITNAADRKRLKAAAQSLDVPNGMGLIVRTAGAARTKTEIKRDYDYLLRLWESIRELTLKSIAPALIYEEEDLVKRALRDMYDKDIESIMVEGESGYREARDFMRMIMPSQAKKIIQHKEATPLFVRHRIEDQLAQLHSTTAPLKSGGYLVINQTEALVAIDVNSGKATRERNIEATALKTNMEAAEEAARQMRLRDLAGLVVIDFIDMDEGKNNRAVEKKMKDCLKDDRARIQMGKISSFGLMEISRQRRRSGVLEGATHVCAHCQGSGRIRTVESSALAALRAVEMEAVRGGGGSINLRLPTAVALYVLNEKRAYLARLETSQGLFVTIQIDDSLAPAEQYIERVTREETRERVIEPPKDLRPEPAEPDFIDEVEEDEEESEAEDEDEDRGGSEGQTDRPTSARSEQDADARGKRRRRRRRGGRRDDGGERDGGPRDGAEREAGQTDADDDEDEGEDGSDGARAPGRDQDAEAKRRRRRRGRRGGRRTHEDERRDVYQWRAPHEERQSFGEDVYAWRDGLGRKPLPEGVRRPDDAGPRPVATHAPPPRSDGALEGGREGGRRRRGRRGGRDQTDLAGAPQPDIADLNDVMPMTAEAVPPEMDIAAPVPEADAPEVGVPAVDAPELVAPELVAPEFVAPEKPKRVRASRARKPKAEAEAVETSEAQASDANEASVVPPVVDAPAEAPAAMPELTVSPPPAAPVAPDPAEIVTPPVQPKRGWWRRS